MKEGMMNSKVKTLVVRFRNELAQREISSFRGAVNDVMGIADESEEGMQVNDRFSNHGDEGLIYRYPQIQYKRIGGKAALVCVQQGTEAIGEFFGNARFDVRIGERETKLDVEHINAHEDLVQVWDTEFRYTIRKWLPLSSNNYREYKGKEGIVEQCMFLEKILIGNILSFAKGVNVTLEKTVTCKITNLEGARWYMHKGVRKLGFDVEFKSNVSIPNYIGLGKAVGFGFGMVVKMS